MRIIDSQFDGQSAVFFVPEEFVVTGWMQRLLQRAHGVQETLRLNDTSPQSVWVFVLEPGTNHTFTRQAIKDRVQQICLVPPTECREYVYCFRSTRPLIVNPAAGSLWCAQVTRGQVEYIYPHPNRILRATLETSESGGRYLHGELITQVVAHQSAVPRWNGGAALRYTPEEFTFDVWNRDLRRLGW